MTLRFPDELHDVARIAAAVKRESLHTYILAAVHAALVRDAAQDAGVAARLSQSQKLRS